jgi:hypothetical protein
LELLCWIVPVLDSDTGNVFEDVALSDAASAEELECVFETALECVFETALECVFETALECVFGTALKCVFETASVLRPAAATVSDVVTELRGALLFSDVVTDLRGVLLFGLGAECLRE